MLRDPTSEMFSVRMNRLPRRALLAAAVLITAVLVYVATQVMRADAETQEATERVAPRPKSAGGAQSAWAPSPQYDEVSMIEVPIADVPSDDDVRHALESEREALRAQLHSKTVSFNERARAMKEYDPILCAHMDHPLCPPYAMSAAELDRLAECGGVKVDTPRFMWREDEPLFDPRWNSVDLSPTERASVEKALAELKDDFERQARATWAEETGDAADAEDLDLAGLNFLMFRGLERPAGFEDALRHVSAELAGRSPSGEPPPHVVEYVGMLAEAGDRIESAVAKSIGASKARELRRAASGWGHTGVTHAGCPEDAPSRLARERIREIDAELEPEDAG